jgi:hypothetical protein
MLAHRFELAATLADDVERVAYLPAPPFRSKIRYLPLGVVTINVPNNWPLRIPAACLGHALLAGNTVVVEPPPTAPLAPTARTFALLAQSLPGVFNVVTGADAEIGPTLIQDERVKKVGRRRCRQKADYVDGGRFADQGVARVGQERSDACPGRRGSGSRIDAMFVQRNLRFHRTDLHGDQTSVCPPVVVRRDRRRTLRHLVQAQARTRP